MGWEPEFTPPITESGERVSLHASPRTKQLTRSLQHAPTGCARGSQGGSESGAVHTKPLAGVTETAKTENRLSPKLLLRVEQADKRRLARTRADAERDLFRSSSRRLPSRLVTSHLSFCFFKHAVLQPFVVFVFFLRLRGVNSHRHARPAKPLHRFQSCAACPCFFSKFCFTQTGFQKWAVSKKSV